jgi:hypothetical protein
LEPRVSLSSSISGSNPLYDFTRVKPLSQRLSERQQGDDQNQVNGGLSADLLRMIQGVMKPEAGKQQQQADNRPDNIYAQIQLNGKTVATIYNSGATETSNAIAAKTKHSDDGQGPELAQQRAEELAAAAGGKIVKSNTALTQAQWQAQQADKPGAIVDPVQQEKQRFYSGLRERSMIADPSMLVQAQLFAQQTMGFDTQTAMSYVPPLDDTMSTESAKA